MTLGLKKNVSFFTKIKHCHNWRGFTSECIDVLWQLKRYVLHVLHFVIFIMHNKVMTNKQISLKIFSFVNLLAFPLFTLPNLALADVYVDLSSAAEIRISNHPGDDSYALKFDEQNSVNAMPIDTENISITILPFQAEVARAAMETGLEPALIHAVIAAESGHKQHAVSKKGATGLMQLMPATAKRFQVKNRYDAMQNILAGAKYLRELNDLYRGDLRLTLAAYNAGPGAVTKNQGRVPPYAETMRYVPKVLKIYRTLAKSAN